MQYSILKTVSLTYEQAIEKVKNELQKEGFGILTSIDVKETLKKKLGIEFKKYIILGACNPPFAHKVLQADDNIGLLLPCNVIVYEKEGKTVTGAFNPMVMMQLIDNPKIGQVAQEVTARLERVINSI